MDKDMKNLLEELKEASENLKTLNNGGKVNDKGLFITFVGLFVVILANIFPEPFIYIGFVLGFGLEVVGFWHLKIASKIINSVKTNKH